MKDIIVTCLIFFIFGLFLGISTSEDFNLHEKMFFNVGALIFFIVCCLSIKILRDRLK